MVRVTTISNILAGIGLAVLGFSAGLKYLLEMVQNSLPPDQTLSDFILSFPLYLWFGGAVLLGLVILLTVINTFTEITGFVHPEDKLVGNMFVFLMGIATILVLGVLDQGAAFQKPLFDISSMIVIAFVFLFIFVFFSSTILEGGESGQLKEMTARFMMVSLVLGIIMAGLKLGLDEIYNSVSYAVAAALLGAVAFILVVVIALALIRKYEPIGE